MDPSRWQRIERLYHAALARPAEARATFLAEACAGDASLQREVERLLDTPATADGIFAGPAVGVAARAGSDPATVGGVDSGTSPLTGRRLGIYQLQAQIGVGGMGEVYRARDTRLGRDVAIKILPVAFTSDPDRLARFEREAKTLAALNHPHIAQIYGFETSDGIRALVMELVEGPTLADRIAHGPVPLDEALPIARQIAEALEAAHEKGIIHRDLKPANIRARSDGTVKVLDFGLAKAMEPTSAMSPNVSQSPTITTPAMMTGIGVILGTAAYMSPEQAKGRTADKRSDIWAFGCVLYEMLTGTRAFEGEDVTDTLAAVLRGDPDWTALPADTPSSTRILLKRCLAKDRKQRIADISIAHFLLTEPMIATPHPGPLGALGARPGVWRRLVYPGAAVVFGLTTIALAGLEIYRFRSAAVPEGVRFSIPPPEGATFDSPDVAQASGRISPDGRTLAFTARDWSGKILLWVRSLDSLDARPLPGTEGAAGLFWSPDSRWIGFFAAGKLAKVAASGGLRNCSVMRLKRHSQAEPGVRTARSSFQQGLVADSAV